MQGTNVNIETFKEILCFLHSALARKTLPGLRFIGLKGSLTDTDKIPEYAHLLLKSLEDLGIAKSSVEIELREVCTAISSNNAISWICHSIPNLFQN